MEAGWTEETAAGGRSDRFPRGMVPVGQHAQVVRLHARHLGSEDLGVGGHDRKAQEEGDAVLSPSSPS